MKMSLLASKSTSDNLVVGEGGWGRWGKQELLGVRELQGQCSGYLQTFAGYMGLALVGDSALRERFNFCFSRVSC